MTAKEKITEKWLKTGLLDSMSTPEDKATLAVILNNAAGAWFQNVDPWFDTAFVFPVIIQTVKTLIETLGSQNVSASQLPAGIDSLTGKAFVVNSIHLPKPENITTGEEVPPALCSGYASQLAGTILDYCKKSEKQRVIVYNVVLQQNYQHLRACFL